MMIKVTELPPYVVLTCSCTRRWFLSRAQSRLAHTRHGEVWPMFEGLRDAARHECQRLVGSPATGSGLGEGPAAGAAGQPGTQRG